MRKGIIRISGGKAYVKGKMSRLVGEVELSIAQVSKIANAGGCVIDISECRVIEIEHLVSMADNNKVVVGAMQTCAVEFRGKICSITNINDQGYAWISYSIAKDIGYALAIHRGNKEAESIDAYIEGVQMVYNAYIGGGGNKGVKPIHEQQILWSYNKGQRKRQA